MDETEQPDFYCSQLALASGEPLYGTALQAEVWFLLEVNQPWKAKATSDNSLPPAVQDWLNVQVAAGPYRRLQFIRQMGAGRDRDLAFFVAIVTDQNPALYRFQLDSYESLFELDIEALLQRDSRFNKHLHPDPLYLVCTNGKRDRCCALYGAEVYRELSAQVGAAAWQTTHLAGHRFAASGILFPSGFSYGHLSPADLPELIAAQEQGTLLLPKLRGRAAYAPVVQTAHFHLCSRLGETRTDAFRFDSCQEHPNGRWTVVFLAQDGGRHIVELVQQADPMEMIASCGQQAPKSRVLYKFLYHRMKYGSA